MKACGLVPLITAFALCFKSRVKKLLESTGALVAIRPTEKCEFSGFQ
jgi:hypothetical protein